MTFELVRYIDADITGPDRELLRAFYTAMGSEGGSMDEVHLRGIRAAIAQAESGFIVPTAVQVASLALEPPAPVALVTLGDLKQQALEQLDCVDTDLRKRGIINTDIIRRALKQLDTPAPAEEALQRLLHWGGKPGCIGYNADVVMGVVGWANDGMVGPLPPLPEPLRLREIAQRDPAPVDLSALRDSTFSDGLTAAQHLDVLRGGPDPRLPAELPLPTNNLANVQPCNADGPAVPQGREPASVATDATAPALAEVNVDDKRGDPLLLCGHPDGCTCVLLHGFQHPDPNCAWPLHARHAGTQF